MHAHVNVGDRGGIPAETSLTTAASNRRDSAISYGSCSQVRLDETLKGLVPSNNVWVEGLFNLPLPHFDLMIHTDSRL